ncbi:MAG: zinc dependent phospholipase C family protein [Candidatus Methanoplasma sp.]|nr:zinc dependent phospholipase C family protein [Candidatus Methanoplasma sp.]
MKLLTHLYLANLLIEDLEKGRIIIRRDVERFGSYYSSGTLREPFKVLAEDGKTVKEKLENVTDDPTIAEIRKSIVEFTEKIQKNISSLTPVNISEYLSSAGDITKEYLRDDEKPLKFPLKDFECTVPKDISDAILKNKKYFRGGSMGPDLLPDPLIGQMIIHSHDSGVWVSYLFECFLKLDKNNPDREKIYAFLLGWMTHYCADMFGHGYVNEYAHGSYPALSEIISTVKAPMIIARHMLVETYMDSRLDKKLIPKNDRRIAVPVKFLASCFSDIRGIEKFMKNIPSDRMPEERRNDILTSYQTLLTIGGSTAEQLPKTEPFKEYLRTFNDLTKIIGGLATVDLFDFIASDDKKTLLLKTGKELGLPLDRYLNKPNILIPQPIYILASVRDYLGDLASKSGSPVIAKILSVLANSFNISVEKWIDVWTKITQDTLLEEIELTTSVATNIENFIVNTPANLWTAVINELPDFVAGAIEFLGNSADFLVDSMREFLTWLSSEVDNFITGITRPLKDLVMGLLPEWLTDIIEICNGPKYLPLLEEPLIFPVNVKNRLLNDFGGYGIKGRAEEFKAFSLCMTASKFCIMGHENLNRYLGGADQDQTIRLFSASDSIPSGKNSKPWKISISPDIMSWLYSLDGEAEPIKDVPIGHRIYEYWPHKTKPWEYERYAVYADAKRRKGLREEFWSEEEAICKEPEPVIDHDSDTSKKETDLLRKSQDEIMGKGFPALGDVSDDENSLADFDSEFAPEKKKPARKESREAFDKKRIPSSDGKDKNDMPMDSKGKRKDDSNGREDDDPPKDKKKDISTESGKKDDFDGKTDNSSPKGKKDDTPMDPKEKKKDDFEGEKQNDDMSMDSGKKKKDDFDDKDEMPMEPKKKGKGKIDDFEGSMESKFT